MGVSETKICSKCGIEKPLVEFYKSKGNRRAECKTCSVAASKERQQRMRDKIGDAAFREKQAKIKRKCISNKTPEERREIRRSWDCESHKPHRPMEEYIIDMAIASGRTAKRRARERATRNIHSMVFNSWEERQSYNYFKGQYVLFGVGWATMRCSGAIKYKLMYRNNVEFALHERIRRQARRAAEGRQYGELIRAAIKREGNSNIVESTLGYTISELKEHLQSLFKDGMSWDCFLKGEIHIDHIVPKSLFDLSNEEQVRECWSLNNLQPLWAKDNLQKWCKLL